MTLLVLSTFPVALILFYVYNKDKYDREPKMLIAKILLFGILSCIPAAIVEMILDSVIFQSMSGTFSVFLSAMFGIAIIEESVKYFALKKTTWKSPHFNEQFDGIVYGVAASLGFAGFENILYVFGGGVNVGWLRAFTAVPMHAAFGIIMGYYYGKARFAEDEAHYKKYLRMSILVPTLFHGFYDFFIMAGNMLYFVLYVVLVIVLYVIGFRTIKKEAKWKDARWQAYFKRENEIQAEQDRMSQEMMFTKRDE